uniref:Uncharacterized protein n=1 Tax=Anopheles gambiae TaxID=7165 RepID=A0A903XVR0_ANOGA
MSSMKSKFGWAEDRKQGHDGNGRKYERSIKLQWKCERNRTDGLASEPNRIEASPSMKFCLQCHAAQLKPSNPTPAGECSGRYRCVSYRCYFPNYTISGIKRRTNKKTKKVCNRCNFKLQRGPISGTRGQLFSITTD